MADPGWPALVASVEARPIQWGLEKLLQAALPDPGAAVAPAETCEALIWRIATLTHPPHNDPEDHRDRNDCDDCDDRRAVELPPDPKDLDLQRPPDLHLVEVLPTIPLTPTPADPAPVRHQLRHLAWMRRPAWPRSGSSHSTAPPSGSTSTTTHRSWAPAYLRDRIGTDPKEAAGCALGYAPPGPRSLLHHLTKAGATRTELLDAELVRTTDKGDLLDVFRDRLVFPIHDADDRLVGFIGRRNPTKDEDHRNRNGPKYLNTRATPLFTKGEALYGLTANRGALCDGADLVLVEGPIDALAVTLHSAHAVGVAPWAPRSPHSKQPRSPPRCAQPRHTSWSPPTPTRRAEWPPNASTGI